MNMPTSLLWMQYRDMVDILCRFLKAECPGNWSLHLQSIREMLSFFASSAYMYLQTMLKLPETNPDILKFEEGFHIVRRSDRFWAGISTDLLIEQVLMRSVKTQGGLTRGKGMTEMQQLLWVQSMPACGDIKEAMQNFSRISYKTSDQHKETSQTRQS